MAVIEADEAPEFAMDEDWDGEDGEDVLGLEELLFAFGEILDEAADGVSGAQEFEPA